MTPEEKNIYVFKWHRFQQRHEVIYTRKFKAALSEQVRQFARTGDTFSISAQPIYNVLIELYKTVGPLWAAHTGVHRLKKTQTKALGTMGFSERIVELMRIYYGIDLLNDAELMTQTSRTLITKVLSDASITGATLNEVVKQLLVDPNFSAMRARRIARTETVTASNGAAIINARQSGLKIKKEWIAIHDQRTRHSHKNVDGSIVDIEDPFNVGGELMMQPGVREQTNGLPTSAAQVVNCRCTTAFIAQRDRAGRLVRTEALAF